MLRLYNCLHAMCTCMCACHATIVTRWCGVVHTCACMCGHGGNNEKGMNTSSMSLGNSAQA